MAAPMKAGIPPDLDIGPGWLLEFVAISPTDGSAVANVTVSSGTLTVQNVGGGNLGELLTPVENVVLLPIADGQVAGETSNA